MRDLFKWEIQYMDIRVNLNIQQLRKLLHAKFEYHFAWQWNCSVREELAENPGIVGWMQMHSQIPTKSKHLQLSAGTALPCKRSLKIPC